MKNQPGEQKSKPTSALAIETPAPDAEHLPSIAELADTLGPEIAGLVETTADVNRTVTGTVLYDRFARAPQFPGAVALANGLALSGDQLVGQLEHMRDAGYRALVYKAHGAPEAELHAAARAAGIVLFRAADSVPWDQLTDILSAAITSHGQSGRSLVDVRPGDLFELANNVASLAGGAVAVADIEQTLLAYSTLPGQPIDETRRNSILQMHVPHTDQNDVDYRRVHASREVVSVAPKAHSFTRSAVAIRAGSVVLGSLWLIDPPDRSKSETDRILLEAANVAALHLLHGRTHRDSVRARHLELVRPLLFEPGRAELAAVQLGIAADRVRVVAIGTWNTAGTTPDAVQSSLRLFDTVRAACAVWLPTAVCGLADNLVYVVLPQTKTSSQAFQREAILRIAHHTRRLLDRPVLAAIGVAMPLEAVIDSRLDAESVLAVLLRDSEDGRVLPGSDDIVADAITLGPRLRLRQIVAALRAAGQLPGEVATSIAAHDAMKGTAFAPTVLTYLDCGSNAIETASRLKLHPNTVRYRLSRLEPLFGVRLDDPESRLLVWLQLWANEN